MAEIKLTEDIFARLDDDINNAIGNIDSEELDSLESKFYNTLKDQLNNFTTLDLDNDGFLKKLGDMQFTNDQDKN